MSPGDYWLRYGIAPPGWVVERSPERDAVLVRPEDRNLGIGCVIPMTYLEDHPEIMVGRFERYRDEVLSPLLLLEEVT